MAASELSRLSASLRERYVLVERDVPTALGALRLAGVRNVDALVDAIDLENEDERLPYWAELWPSALGLAHHITHHSEELVERWVLELGCGLGLVGLAAAAAGASVVAMDYDPDAVRFARLNALINGLTRLWPTLMDWRHPAFAPRFDCVLAADIIYEARFLVPIADAIEAALVPGGRAIVAEPGREVAEPFFDLVGERGWSVREIGREGVPGPGLREVQVGLFELVPG